MLLPGEGVYEWEVIDKGTSLKGTFEVRIFTQNAVAQALKEGRNFELLD